MSIVLFLLIGNHRFILKPKIESTFKYKMILNNSIMKHKFRVIKDFPFSPYDIGDEIEPSDYEVSVMKSYPDIFRDITIQFEVSTLKEYNLSYDDLVNGKFYTCEYPNRDKYTFKCGYKLWRNNTCNFVIKDSFGNFTPENGFTKFREATQLEIDLLTV